MKKLGLLSLVVLSACNISWGPHNVTLDVSEGVTMTDRKGNAIEFASESSNSLVATYSSSKKVLTLSHKDIAGNKHPFDFKGIVLNKDDDSLSGDQESTGQNLAVFIKRNFVGQTVSDHESWRSCTYYEQRRQQHCYTDNQGHTRCNTYWENVPMHGQQLVRIETTVRNYSLEGRLAQSIGTLGLLSGSYADTDHDYTALSGCR